MVDPYEADDNQRSPGKFFRKDFMKTYAVGAALLLSTNNADVQGIAIGAAAAPGLSTDVVANMYGDSRK